MQENDQGVETQQSASLGKHSPTVVGIGASAGGLAALKAFFSEVPESTGLAYVVVMHLSPDHESHLADLLQPYSRLPVQQVNETVLLETDCVYVIPPGFNLSAIDSHLRLTTLEEKRLKRAPIDHFFRTLAATHDGGSVGVILTGTGSDGTLGIREIKACGGLIVVQDPNEAEFDGMPQSAITTRLADLVLPIKDMPGEIVRYARTNPRVTIPLEGGSLEDHERDIRQKILVLVRIRTGRDFTRYKHSTVTRRIQRRMQLHHIEELSGYLDLLRSKPDEAKALADELLINVTNFFRDREVFDHLAKEVIPQLFEGKTAGDTIRVWSVGCATGEEAYSLAILLIEEAARRDKPPTIQVFASDLHDRSLQTAREGFYPGDIEIDVSPERVRRFFTKKSGGFKILSEVRELVIFAPHNLLSDPPFSRIDLITCRNVLIYLQRDVQLDVAEMFHYALVPDGYLLLGSSESVDRSDLFSTENKAYCLYQKCNVPTQGVKLPAFPLTKPPVSERPRTSQPHSQLQQQSVLSYGALHQRMVERYAPPSLLVDSDHKIVHSSEQVGRYLVHPGGEPTYSVFKLLREELRLDLRAALVAAEYDGKPLRTKPVKIRLEGQSATVIMRVRPPEIADDLGLSLVMFEERAQDPKNSVEVETIYDPSYGELEGELDLNKQRLKDIIEEYETSQENMKAANEGLQSSNEELHSAMEELETSKEELQSMNEELATVNQENRLKVDELAQLSSDLHNLLTATDIATLFLDRDLRILRFTPSIATLFNIRPADRGRPLSDLTHRLGYDTMAEDAEQVLEHLIPIDREIRDVEGCWYLTRVRPYRTTDDHIGGVVITFVDITEHKQYEDELLESEERFRVLVDTSAQTVWTTDAKGIVVSESRSWQDYTGQSFAQFSGAGWLDAVHSDDRDHAWAQWCHSVDTGTPFLTEFRIFHAPSGQYRWTDVRARALRGPDGAIRTWVGMNMDINEQKLAEQALMDMNETLEARVEERTAQVRDLASRLTMAEQEERRRVSQILHDELQQLLYGVQMKMRMLQDKLQASGDQNMTNMVADTQTWLAEAIEMTRQLTVDLSPPILKNEGLAESLEWLQRQMFQLHALEVSLHTRRAPHMPNEDLRVLLFQTVRELLFNIKKHAGVDQAEVELDQSDSEIMIRVIDHGRGFDQTIMQAEQDKAPGFGLISSRERLSLFGGAMEINSVPGDGTSILIRVPSERCHSNA